VLHTVANLVLEVLEDRRQKMIFFQRLEQILNKTGVETPRMVDAHTA
jgi:hypothetical protein